MNISKHLEMNQILTLNNPYGIDMLLDKTDLVVGEERLKKCIEWLNCSNLKRWFFVNVIVQ